MSATVYVLGWYGHNNLGDEAILAGIRQELLHQAPTLKIFPFTDIKYSDCPWIGNLRDRKKLAEINQKADLLLIGGGDIIHTFSGIFVDSRWLQQLTIPKMLYAVGVDRWEKKMTGLFSLFAASAACVLRTNKRIRNLCNCVELVTVRDAQSKEYLMKLNINKEPILVPDPSISLPPKAIQVSLPKGYRIGVAITDRWWLPKKHQIIAKGLDKLAETAEIIFLLFGRKSDDNNDFITAQKVISCMRHREKTIIIDQPFSPEEMLYLIGQMDAVICERLHSVIFAVMSGVKFLAISYEAKVDSFLRLVGMEKYSVPLSRLKATDISRLKDISFTPISHSLLQRLKREASENAQRALDLL